MTSVKLSMGCLSTLMPNTGGEGGGGEGGGEGGRSGHGGGVGMGEGWAWETNEIYSDVIEIR